MGPQTSFLQRGLLSNWQILVNAPVLGPLNDVLEGNSCEESLGQCCGKLLWGCGLPTAYNCKLVDTQESEDVGTKRAKLQGQALLKVARM